MSTDIKLENLSISPEVCPVDTKVNISVIATNYGDEPGSRTIKFQYKEVKVMTVTFSGAVSAQEGAGELVTITVTLPDESTEPVTTTTLAAKTFSVQYAKTPGNYKAKARVEADALYQAAESEEVLFVIGKQPRTITLTVK